MSAFELHATTSPKIRMPQRAAGATRLESGTIVCEACGCRLSMRESIDDDRMAGDRTWWHFGGQAGRDARGCTVGCVEKAHHLV